MPIDPRLLKKIGEAEERGYGPEQIVGALSKSKNYPDVANKITAASKRGYDFGAILQSIKDSPVSYADVPWSQVGKEAVQNIPGSAKEYGAAMIEPLKHPIETAKALGNVGMGLVEKLIPGVQEEEQYWDGIAQLYVERYGSIDGLKKAIATKPVEVMGDLSAVVGGAGGAARVIGTVGKIQKVTDLGRVLQQTSHIMEPVGAAMKATGAVAKPIGKIGARTTAELLGITTGTGYGSIKEGFAAAREGGKRWDAYKTAMREGGTGVDILTDAKSALEKLKLNRSKGYEQKLAQVAGNNNALDVSSLFKKMDSMMGSYGIKRLDDGTLDFSQSNIRIEERANIVKLIDEIDAIKKPVAGNRTAVVLDRKKQVIDGFYTESSNTSAFTASLRSELRDILAKNVPGYDDLTKDYAKLSDDIREINRTLSIKSGNKMNTDTAIRKLTTALKENNEYRASVVQSLEEVGGKELLAQIAGLAASPYLPRGAMGKIIGGIQFAGGMASGMELGYFGILAAGSPRLVGEFISVLGKASRESLGLSQFVPPAEARMAAFQAGRAKREADMRDADGKKHYIDIRPPAKE